MQAVIDSVSMHHLIRSPKLLKKHRRKGNSRIFETSLDRHLKEGRLTLAIDKALGLIDEWKRTCGVECVQVLITCWESFAAIVIIDPVSKIPRSVCHQLSFMGCIDRLLLRIGMATADRIVVSDDSDFWDPARPDKRGDPNAKVAKLCKDRLDITVLLLKTLLVRLRTS